MNGRGVSAWYTVTTDSNKDDGFRKGIEVSSTGVQTKLLICILRRRRCGNRKMCRLKEINC